MSDKDFGFAFEKPDGWTKVELPCAEANSLREAIAAEPALATLTLSEVWCLHTCNLIWASEGAYHTGPWQDPE